MQPVQKSSPEREALGRSYGGFSTKIHIRCEGTGKLITFLLTPGQESDIGQAEELMENGAIRRRSGHMRLRPERLVADKGYTSAVCEPIFIATISAAPSLGAATNHAEVHSTNNTTEREISLKDSSIVSSNFGALLLAMKNEPPTLLP